jgi:hypothetical protein
MSIFTRRHVKLSAAVAISVPASAWGANGLRVESVNNYPTGGSVANSIANGQGFINKMLQGGDTTWSSSHYTDGDVYDTDFMDPQRTGNAADLDYTYFDRLGASISYFTGHGTCGYGSCWGGPCPGQPCTDPPSSPSNQCLSPNFPRNRSA